MWLIFCLAVAFGLPQETISSVCPAITYKQEAFQDTNHFYVRFTPDRPTDQFAFVDIHFELTDPSGVVLEQANYPMIRYNNNREFLSELVSERMKTAVASGVGRVRYSFTYCLAANPQIDCNTGPYEFTIRPQGFWRANPVVCPNACGLSASTIQVASRCVSSTGMDLDASSCAGNPGTSMSNCPATMPCPCQVGGWSDWSTFCSQKCGGGTKTRTRSILNPGDNNCPPLIETASCNTEPCRVPVPVPVGVPVPVPIPIQTSVNVPAPYEVRVPVPIPVPAPFEVQVQVPNPVPIPIRVPVTQQVGIPVVVDGGPAAAFQSWAPPDLGAGPGGPPFGLQSWGPPGEGFGPGGAGGGFGGGFGGVGISPFASPVGFSPFASSAIGVSPFVGSSLASPFSGGGFQSYGSTFPLGGQVAGYSPFTQQFGGVSNLNSGAFVQGSGNGNGWSSFEQATQGLPTVNSGSASGQLLSNSGTGQQLLSRGAGGQQVLLSAGSDPQVFAADLNPGLGPASQAGSFGLAGGPLGSVSGLDLGPLGNGLGSGLGSGLNSGLGGLGSGLGSGLGGLGSGLGSGLGGGLGAGPAGGGF